MIALGHRVSVCRSLEDVLTALEAAGVPAIGMVQAGRHKACCGSSACH
jgi:hypothetical protein